MAFANVFRIRCYAAALMTAIVLLHVAFASISPEKLSHGFSNSGVGSYFKALNITGANTTSAGEMQRNRDRTPAGRLFIASECTTVKRVDLQAYASLIALFLCDWIVEIGQEQAAAPHSDMVARK